MAGNPANMTIAPYQDGTATNDHSYYGFGCNNGWGTSGEDGSQTPCPDSNAGGRYVTTADGETQKNGTYYNFQATTVGTGGTMSTKNADAPDAFCPVGWQLPYSGTGGDYYDKSKSWKYLFTAYSYSDDIQGRTGVMSYPISNIKSGMFIWNMGRLYFLNSRIDAWTATVKDSGAAYEIRNVLPAVVDRKTLGIEVR